MPVQQPDRERPVTLLVQAVVGHERDVADQDEPSGSSR